MGSLFDTPEFNERLFFPRSDATATPPGARDAFVDVPGARLHLRWHVRADAPTVLLFHGNGEVVADYDDAAAAFARCGAGLAVVDFRGYGRSTGTPTLRRAIDDAPAVLAALLAAGAQRVVVMGRSLGSACAAELYARANDAAVHAFVLESGFVDLRALIARRGIVPPARLAPDDDAAFEPLAKLARTDRALLVLHGADDELIAPSEAQRAFDAAGAAQKQLVLVPGRGHNDLSLEPLYWDAMRAFVAAVRPP